MKSFKEIIQNGGVAVMRTDTLYGLVADAKNPEAVSRIYEIKGRNPLKAVIVLVANYAQIQEMGIVINEDLKSKLDQHWPGKVSVILPVNNNDAATHHIHKGTGGIAFRIPDDEKLRKTLNEVGPLVAPSANPEGMPPAKTILEAERYFKDQVDYYLDGGEVSDDTPSKIIKIHKDHIKVIRD